MCSLLYIIIILIANTFEIIYRIPVAINQNIVYHKQKERGMIKYQTVFFFNFPIPHENKQTVEELWPLRQTDLYIVQTVGNDNQNSLHIVTVWNGTEGQLEKQPHATINNIMIA